MTTEPKGRKLDAWLGSALGTLAKQHNFIYQEGADWSGFYCSRCDASESTINDPCVPHYSTDLTAAMQLAEKLTDRFHWRICSPFDQEGEWFAGLTPLGVTGWNGRPDYEASAYTLSVAISLAAYRALRDAADDEGDTE